MSWSSDDPSPIPRFANYAIHTEIWRLNLLFGLWTSVYNLKVLLVEPSSVQKAVRTGIHINSQAKQVRLCHKPASHIYQGKFQLGTIFRSNKSKYSSNWRLSANLTAYMSSFYRYIGKLTCHKWVGGCVENFNIINSFWHRRSLFLFFLPFFFTCSSRKQRLGRCASQNSETKRGEIGFSRIGVYMSTLSDTV